MITRHSHAPTMNKRWVSLLAILGIQMHRAGKEIEGLAIKHCQRGCLSHFYKSTIVGKQRCVLLNKPISPCISYGMVSDPTEWKCQELEVACLSIDLPDDKQPRQGASIIP